MPRRRRDPAPSPPAAGCPSPVPVNPILSDAEFEPLNRQQLIEIEKQVDLILAGIREMYRHVYRLVIHVDVLRPDEAAARAGLPLDTFKRIAARGLFTDGRAPERRVSRVVRLYFSDELDAYRDGGEAGLALLRVRLGRG